MTLLLFIYFHKNLLCSFCVRNNIWNSKEDLFRNLLLWFITVLIFDIEGPNIASDWPSYQTTPSRIFPIDFDWRWLRNYAQSDWLDGLWNSRFFVLNDRQVFILRIREEISVCQTARWDFSAILQVSFWAVWFFNRTFSYIWST